MEEDFTLRIKSSAVYWESLGIDQIQRSPDDAPVASSHVSVCHMSSQTIQLRILFAYYASQINQNLHCILMVDEKAKKIIDDWK